MWEFLRQNQFVVGALSGSLAAYLLGLLVSHLKREKKWLGYTVGSRNIVKRGHSSLSLKFQNSDIERLDSHVVVLRNIGNRPLVKLPVRIDCPGAKSIVEHEVKCPDGSEIQTTLEKPHLLVVDLDLLNPEEAIEVGLTVVDSSEAQVQVVARAENLLLKEMSPSLPTAQLIDILLSSSGISRAVIDVVRLLR